MLMLDFMGEDVHQALASWYTPGSCQQIITPSDGNFVSSGLLCYITLANFPLVHIACNQYNLKLRRLPPKLLSKTALPWPQFGRFPTDDHLAQIVFACYSSPSPRRSRRYFPD